MEGEKRTRERPAFTSAQSRLERLLALCWLPVHLYLLPRAIWHFFPGLDTSWLNVAVYGTGAVFMLITQFGFLRRDFDPLCDRPGYMLLEILVSYGAMLLFNMAVSGLLMLFLGDVDNPNNAAVVDMAQTTGGPVAALAIFLAPLLEENIFRAGIFGGLRRFGRLPAYLVCMLLFSVYHVWGYALDDPAAWVYMLQYLPVGFLLCRIYERTNSIWGCILLHMFINFVALNALTMLEKLL